MDPHADTIDSILNNKCESHGFIIIINETSSSLTKTPQMNAMTLSQEEMQREAELKIEREAKRQVVTGQD